MALHSDSSDADTTVTGCQMVTLFAVKNAGIAVPDETIKKGLAFLATCRGRDGDYGYTSASGGKPTLTAIGSLCLSLAKERDSKGYQASLAYLKKNIDFRDRYYPFYFEYYMSQALFHADEATWREWNARNIRYLSTIQSADGSFPGNQGASFNTAGALLSLALNYRFPADLRKMIRKLAIPWVSTVMILAAAEPPDLMRFANGDQLHGTFQGIQEGPQ